MNGLIEKTYAATVGKIESVDPTSTTISGLVTTIGTWITYIAGVAAFIYLVYSGILYISAAGNPDQAKKGQQGIINAVIGIIIVVLAFTIIKVVSNTATTNL